MLKECAVRKRLGTPSLASSGVIGAAWTTPQFHSQTTKTRVTKEQAGGESQKIKSIYEFRITTQG